MTHLDPVAPHVFRRAVRAVRAGDLAQIVQDDMTAKVGRARAQTWEATFVLWMIVALEGGASDLHLTKAQTVADRLSDKQCEEIGLRRPVPYSQMESALADLADAMEETVDQATGEVKPARLSVSLTEFATRLVSQVLPASLRRRATLAMDSTDFETWHRRRSWASHMKPDDAPDALPEDDFDAGRKGGSNEPGWPLTRADGRLQHTWDPDACEGYRTGKNRNRKSTFVGWDAHLITQVPEQGGAAEAHLVVGVALAPAGSYKADAGLDLLDAVTRLHGKPEIVLVDRGYSYAKQECWALPLAERGIEQVFDLHTTQRGARPGPIPGTIWLDGAVFVDGLPNNLRSLPGYRLGMSAEDKAQLAEQYDNRAAWAFSTMGGPHPTRSTQRMRGPAQAGRVRCANNPRSKRLDPGTRPTTKCVKGTPCACGKTLTLPREEMAQVRQADLFGTTAWKASYGRRSGVESLNASTSLHHGKVGRGSTRVLGTRRNGILLAFLLAAVNVHILLARYGYDISNPPPEGTEITPLPSKSKALHRRLPFKRRPRRTKSRPPGSAPPTTATRWASPHSTQKNMTNAD